MPTSADLVSWARHHATELEADMALRPQSVTGYGGHRIKAPDLAAESRIRGASRPGARFPLRDAGRTRNGPCVVTPYSM